jgi:phage-related protein
MPQIINSITTFLQGDGFSKLLAAGGQLFMAIVEAVPTIISSLKSSLGTMLASIATDLEGNQSEVMAAAYEMLQGLVMGIIQIHGVVTEAVAQVLVDMAAKVKDKVADWVTMGGNLIDGLKQGFINKLSGVTSAITNGAKSIAAAAKSALGIASPSKVFAEIGEFCAEGLGLGWDEEIEDVNNTIEKDLKYKGDIDITTKTSDVTAPITRSQTSDESFANMRLVLNNTTVVDGEVIEEKSYTYMINRMGEELTATKIAEGGGY